MLIEAPDATGLQIPPYQYSLRRVADRNQALAQVLRDFTQYDTYPVNPNRPTWLQELLDRLAREGVLPVGELAPVLQATELYFQTLA